jgi:hypothetical protein
MFLKWSDYLEALQILREFVGPDNKRVMALRQAAQMARWFLRFSLIMASPGNRRDSERG